MTKSPPPSRVSKTIPGTQEERTHTTEEIPSAFMGIENDTQHTGGAHSYYNRNPTSLTGIENDTQHTGGTHTYHNRTPIPSRVSKTIPGSRECK